jgi:hypothetical protein
MEIIFQSFKIEHILYTRCIYRHIFIYLVVNPEKYAEYRYNQSKGEYIEDGAEYIEEQVQNNLPLIWRNKPLYQYYEIPHQKVFSDNVPDIYPAKNGCKLAIIL